MLFRLVRGDVKEQRFDFGWEVGSMRAGCQHADFALHA